MAYVPPPLAPLGRQERCSIRGQHVFVVYEHCSLRDKEDFERQLKSLLPAGALYYGSKEDEAVEGRASYRVLVQFAKRMCYTDGARRFSVGGGPLESVVIEDCSYSHLSVSGWLEEKEAEVERDDKATEDLFGKKITCVVDTRKGRESDGIRVVSERIRDAVSLRDALSVSLQHVPEEVIWRNYGSFKSYLIDRYGCSEEEYSADCRNLRFI